MELKRKITVAVSTGALLFSSIATPVLAGTTLEISGNGSDSNNEVKLETKATTYVEQNNNANISNKVNVDADTGRNDANDNTGGDVEVSTGNVDTQVTVANQVNSNTAKVDCCKTGNTDVLISGNGSDSDNKVELSQEKNTAVFQNNYSNIKNYVDANGNTGKNDANDNTGGSVEIKTGDVDTKVAISNSGNVNAAKIGDGGNGGGSVSARILGNGSDSDNEIKLKLASSTYLDQSNNAYIKNDVDVDANTGKNDANDNTGGDVMIETGDVDTEVEIDNMVNFNAADVDCVCLLSDLLAKIAGNGSDSDNKIRAELAEELAVFQDNCGRGEWTVWQRGGKCGVTNDVDVDGDTGKNDANDNTGDPGSDPSVETGDVDTSVELGTSGNTNVFGDTDFELPDWSLDHFKLSFDLGGLLVLLGLLG
jgi:hypothetical protein